MSDYILIMIHEKLRLTGDRSPQHVEPGAAIRVSLARASAHKLDRGLGQRAHGGGYKLQRPVQKDTLGYRGLGDLLNFQEGCDAGAPGLVGETSPDSNLLQNLILLGIGD